MGLGTRVIKRRIKATKNISKITKTMEMVAAAKMRKAQKEALSGKPYSEKLIEVIGSLTNLVDPAINPLLKEHEEVKKYLLVLITTNRGLCGSLNTNLLRTVNKFTEEVKGQGISFDFLTIGRKGQGFAARRGGYLADFSDKVPFIGNTKAIISLIVESFLAAKYSRIYLVYNNFIHALKQEAKISPLLPISAIDIEEKRKKPTGEIIFEPDPKEILEELLPFYLENQVRKALLESEASEHSARMVAMHNATMNANDLTYGLTLEFNKMRQSVITAELADITTAKLSIEK